jgi:hypothetical protein
VLICLIMIEMAKSGRLREEGAKEEKKEMNDDADEIVRGEC